MIGEWWLVQSNETGIYKQNLASLNFRQLDAATNSISFILAFGLFMHNMVKLAYIKFLIQFAVIRVRLLPC